MELDFKYVRRTGRLYDGGNERVRYIIETVQLLDALDGNEINDFYQEMGSVCEDFCRNELIENLCKLESVSRYYYALESSVTQCKDDALSILLRAKLKNGRKTMSDFVFSNVWSISDRCLMSNKELIKKYAGKRKITGEGIFILENGVLVQVNNVEIDKFMSKRKNS